MSFVLLTRNMYNTGRHKQKKTKNSKHKNLVAQKYELYFFGTGDLGRNTGKAARQVHLTLHYFAEIV
jgi:hypothetical protein